MKAKDIEGFLPEKRLRYSDNEFFNGGSIGYNQAISEIGEKEIEIDVGRVERIINEYCSGVKQADKVMLIYGNLAQAIKDACPIKGVER